MRVYQGRKACVEPCASDLSMRGPLSTIRFCSNMCLLCRVMRFDNFSSCLLMFVFICCCRVVDHGCLDTRGGENLKGARFVILPPPFGPWPNMRKIMKSPICAYVPSFRFLLLFLPSALFHLPGARRQVKGLFPPPLSLIVNTLWDVIHFLLHRPPWGRPRARPWKQPPLPRPDMIGLEKEDCVVQVEDGLAAMEWDRR